MLVDREGELEALRAGLAAARAGRGTVLLIEGEAGAGKTRLLLELREEAEAAAVRVLSARGGPLERDFGWGITRALLEPALVDPERRAKALGGAAALASVVLDDAAPGTADDGARQRALHGLYWLTVNLTDEGPLLVVVDDLQWVDAETLGWLAYLVRRAESLPIVIALATRPERSGPAAGVLDLIADDPITRHLRPRPLTVEAIARLTTEALADPAPDGAFVREIARVTAGNAFFTRALLREAAAHGLAPRASQAARLAALGPESVGRTVLRRIDALGDGATVVTQALAVLEEPSSPETLALISGRPAAAVRQIAEDLIDAGVLADALPLDFVHPIVRTIVSDAVGLAERPGLSARGAAALAALGADVERVASRIVQVPPGTALPAQLGDPVELLVRAGQAAVSRGVPAAAVAYADHALALADPGDPRREGLGLARARADALLHKPGWEDRLVAAARGAADPAIRASAMLEATRSLAAVGDFGRASVLGAELLADESLPLSQDTRVALRMEALALGLLHPDAIPQAASRSSGCRSRSG